MTVSHHPHAETLMAFGAGTVSEPQALAISAHLTYCRECRAIVADAEAIGGALIEDADAAPMRQLDRATILALLERQTIDVSATRAQKSGRLLPGLPARLPETLHEYAEEALEKGQWRFVAPGIRQLALATKGRGRARLLRLEPGTVLPRHSHGGCEMTVLLSGSYSDELGTFSTGDMAELDESVIHRPVVNQGEVCTALVVTDGKLKFQSWLAKIVQPFVRI